VTQTGNDLEAAIVAKALKDDAFRARLRQDPKGAVQSELNVELPDKLVVSVIEDQRNLMNLVIPYIDHEVVAALPIDKLKDLLLGTCSSQAYGVVLGTCSALGTLAH
jgi:hypothetical protein